MGALDRRGGMPLAKPFKGLVGWNRRVASCGGGEGLSTQKLQKGGSFGGGRNIQVFPAARLAAAGRNGHADDLESPASLLAAGWGGGVLSGQGAIYPPKHHTNSPPAPEGVCMGRNAPF